MSTIFSPLDSHVPPNFIVDVHNVLTGEEFEQLCRDNRDTRMELTARGELILMPPTGSKTGALCFRVIGKLAKWTEADGNGLGLTRRPGSSYRTAPGVHLSVPGYVASAGRDSLKRKRKALHPYVLTL